MLTHTCDISIRCTVHIYNYIYIRFIQIHQARESQSLWGTVSSGCNSKGP